MLVKLSKSKKFANDYKKYQNFIIENSNPKATQLVSKLCEELTMLANKIDVLHESSHNGVVRPALAKDLRDQLINCKRKIDKILKDSKYL